MKQDAKLEALFESARTQGADEGLWQRIEQRIGQSVERQRHNRFAPWLCAAAGFTAYFGIVFVAKACLDTTETRPEIVALRLAARELHEIGDPLELAPEHMLVRHVAEQEDR